MILYGYVCEYIFIYIGVGYLWDILIKVVAVMGVIAVWFRAMFCLDFVIIYVSGQFCDGGVYVVVVCELSIDMVIVFIAEMD